MKRLWSLLFLLLFVSVQCIEELTDEHQTEVKPPENKVQENVKSTEEKETPRKEIEKAQHHELESTEDVETVPENPETNPEKASQPSPAPRVLPPEKTGKIMVPYDYSNYDSLKTRVEPPDIDNQQRGSGLPYVLTEQRLRELRNEFMYWYFDQGGNDNNGCYQKAIQTSSPQIHKNLNFQLPFFGFRFNYTRISMNGYLEFSDPPEQFSSYPLVFPVKDWPKVNDPSFIGIFYSKMRIGKIRTLDVDQRKPGVYFRLVRDLQTRNDQFAVEVRERVKWDIREGVIGSETFEPKHVIIATWKNMSFAGGFGNALYVTNTFQLVLATDEVFTYAIFNYLDLQWTTHTEAGGDTTSGENGVPAFVGFNAGNGTQSWEYFPYSQRSTVRDLTGRGFANNFKGRHIFRIDEKIMMGTCNKDIDGANLPLVFAPESGNMLGGTVVNITGPCFEITDRVTCRFDTEEVRGAVVTKNRAICVQPMNVYAEGYIRFEVSIGNGKYNWKGKFFIETPATAAERIYFEDRAVYEKSPKEIKITWEKYNLTMNQNAPVRISLWGYRETTIRPELQYIDLLDPSVQNSGAYTIVPANYKLRENRLQDDMQFGFIQINLTDSQSYNGLDITPVIWSRPIPLGWYFGPQWEKQFGTKWPAALCDNWLKNDRYLKNFAHELPQCPCTLEQALNDKGRYLPDFECDKDLNPKCMYHVGALHCVRSGSPSLEGSEQQCCYDKNKYLMLSYDQQWGSRPFRAHNLGYIPWNEANKVPTLSQWFHDMVPYFSCCMWQEEQSVGCETFRFERRPSQDCVAYQPPGVATIFGDPHIVTFDNLRYTFNGKGEFVLVRTNTKDLRLDVQGRFEQLPPNAYGEVRATQLTSVVAKGNNSAVIEVRLRPRYAQWRYRLDVFADGKRVYFDRPALKFQHFPGVTVYTPTYLLNQSEVVVMFDTGAGVEVIENKGYMAARVYLPWNFINKTRGLFGNWSFDILDDFTLPDGTVTGISTTTTNLNDFESMHKNFAIEWMVQDNEDPTGQRGRAMFYREFGRTSSYYTNRTFEPVFKSSPKDIIPENRTAEREKAYELCGDTYQCLYDYSMSLNRDLAHYTKNYLNSYTAIRADGEKRILSCGVLETPRFGRKSNFLFTPGTKVSFECNQNFILVGDKRRTCEQNGRWSVPEYGYTECLRLVEYESINAGITTGIVIAILFPMLSCLAATAYCLYKKRNKEATTAWEFNIPRSRSNSRAKLNDPTLYSQEHSPLESPNRVQSPVSDTSSLASNKIKRTYDKMYRTNEPLPGKPDYEWEEKDFDLSPEGSEFDQKSPSIIDNQPVESKWNYSPDEQRSPTDFKLQSNSPSDSPRGSSPYSTFGDTPSKPKPPPARMISDPDYIEVAPGNMSTDTLDSGLGHDKHEQRPYTMYEPEYPTINEKLQSSSSQPILNYTDADYTEVLKPKNTQKPSASMSSKITAV